MNYKVEVGRPPNFEQIAAVFPLAQRSTTIFAYHDTIFMSSEGIMLPPQLVKHECVHLQRQQELGVETWWERYLADYAFRYNEEVHAHRAEYQELVRIESNRNMRRHHGRVVTKRLMAPLYKFKVSKERAFKDITGEYHD